MFSENHNIGERLQTPYASAPTALTAAGAGDNTAITGAILDRYTYNDPLSLRLAIQAIAVLAATKTLTIKSATIQHGDASNLSDAAAWATLEDSTGTVIATGGGGGSTEKVVKTYDVNLNGAKRYIRVDFTPDLNASGTDTAVVSAQVIFGKPKLLN